MSSHDALDYDKLKEALLKRYQLTEEGLRSKFRECKADYGETPSQFITRLNMYLTRWVDMAKITKSYDGLFEMMVKEQFLTNCAKDLAMYLREKPNMSIEELSQMAERYMEAHGQNLSTLHNNKTVSNKKWWSRNGHDQGRGQRPNTVDKKCTKCLKFGHVQSECRSKLNVSEVICHRCNKPGHKAPDCRSTVSPAPQRPYVGYKDRECYICHKTGHISRDCKTFQTASVAVNCAENVASVNKGSACVQINTHVPCCDDTKCCDCISDTEVKLACGKMFPIFSGACRVANDEMPVTKGLVGSMEVEMLRDTGCSGVVVSRSMISDDQLLDKTERCMLIDGSILKVPMACIDILRILLVSQSRQWL